MKKIKKRERKKIEWEKRQKNEWERERERRGKIGSVQRKRMKKGRKLNEVKETEIKLNGGEKDRMEKRIS